MTKFEEEVKRPDNGPITELNNSMHSVLSQYRKMREYADYLEYELKQKDEHILKLENENSFMRDERTTFDSNGMAVEPKLQQQALPVVPECVDLFIKECRKFNYDLDQAFYEQEDGSEATENNKCILWRRNHPDEFARAWLDGYTVEKPQLFYLKNKLTGMWLMRDEVDEVYPYDHTFNRCHRGKFTQQEIDSMQTGSYELVPVEDGE